MFPIAKERGAATAIITASETPYDAHADWKIGEALERATRIRA